MIWFSVPFVGYKSECYERFKGMYLYDRENVGASILDPRFKEVRDYLTDIYVNSVKKYGWDGLKLDFIDSFMLKEGSPCDFERMDTVSGEEGLQMLLKETMEKLKSINPEIMIEFRQSYVGPAISKFGNIFRVGDCPEDPINNRVQSLNLRLTSGNTAVHSDMIMWHKNDTNESVLYQLLGTMFAVPQISVRFDNITSDHKKLLKNYLSFWRENQDVILNGEITVRDMQGNYSLAQSKKDNTCVAVLYQSVIKCLEDVETEYIFNASGYDNIYVDSNEGKKYEIYDIFGGKYKEGTTLMGVTKFLLKTEKWLKFSNKK
jgi:alpha-galactosidase